jgi:uncharacterized protein YacL (UPF0231 family)
MSSSIIGAEFSFTIEEEEIVIQHNQNRAAGQH